MKNKHAIITAIFLLFGSLNLLALAFVYYKLEDDVINYHFHPTQKIKELENGNIEVKFKSGGKLAMCYEFFKWGDKVKIKKPVELKQYYKDYLQYVLDNI